MVRFQQQIEDEDMDTFVLQKKNDVIKTRRTRVYSRSPKGQIIMLWHERAEETESYLELPSLLRLIESEKDSRDQELTPPRIISPGRPKTTSYGPSRSTTARSNSSPNPRGR